MIYVHHNFTPILYSFSDYKLCGMHINLLGKLQNNFNYDIHVNIWSDGYKISPSQIK